jgi:zinc protease|nr:MAG: hypothetical protein KatS3mg041_0018 [Bacteroidota bacterium]
MRQLLWLALLGLVYGGCVPRGLEKPESIMTASRIPEPAPPRPVRFPDIHRQTLPNGLRLYTITQPEQPLVHFLLTFRGGRSVEEPEGAADLVAQLLTEGTRRRSSTELADAIDRLGAELSASAGWDGLSIEASGLARFADQLMALMAEVALEATFPEEELERIRRERLGQLAIARNQTRFLASVATTRLLFGPGHPYNRVTDERALQALRREDLVAYHRRWFRPDNAFLIAAGDIRPEEARALAERFLGSWSAPPDPLADPAMPESSPRPGLYLIDRPGAVQSTVRAACRLIPASHPDYLALQVLNTLLGGYFGSRLNMNLRETRGYTYGAGSFVDARRWDGLWVASADVRTEVTDSALAEILHEVRRIRSEPIPIEEHRNVINYLAGSFVMDLETPTQIARLVQEQLLRQLPEDFFVRYRDRVLQMSPQELQRVARIHLDPDRLLLIVAGDRERLRPLLERIGPVEEVDF